MTVSQHHGDVVVVVTIHGDEVGIAITVEVGNAQTVGMRLAAVLHHDRGGRCRLKVPPAIPKQKDHAVAVMIGQCKVQVLVAIDVTDSDFVRTLRNIERCIGARDEATIAELRRAQVVG